MSTGNTQMNTWQRMHYDELIAYLAELGAAKTAKPNVFKAPGVEIIVRPVGGKFYDVREVKCDC